MGRKTKLGGLEIVLGGFMRVVHVPRPTKVTDGTVIIFWVGGGGVEPHRSHMNNLNDVLNVYMYVFIFDLTRYTADR